MKSINFQAKYKILVLVAFAIILLTILAAFFLSSRTSTNNPTQETNTDNRAYLSNQESVVQVTKSNGETNLEVVDTNGNTIRQLTDEHTVNFKMAPNKQIVFFTTQKIPARPDDYQKLSLNKVNIDGSNAEMLLPEFGYQMEFAANTSGSKVAITTRDTLTLLDVNSKELTELITYPVTGADSEFAYIPEPFWVNDDKDIALKVREADYYQTKQVSTYHINIETKQKTLISTTTDNVY